MKQFVRWILRKHEQTKLKSTLKKCEELSSTLCIIMFTNTISAGCHIKLLLRGEDVTKQIPEKLKNIEKIDFPKLSKGRISENASSFILFQITATDKEWVGLELGRLFKAYPLFYQRGRADQTKKNWRTTGLDTMTVWTSKLTPSEIYQQVLQSTNQKMLDELRRTLT